LSSPYATSIVEKPLVKAARGHRMPATFFAIKLAEIYQKYKPSLIISQYGSPPKHKRSRLYDIVL
jgi:hypothetical protein